MIGSYQQMINLIGRLKKYKQNTTTTICGLSWSGSAFGKVRFLGHNLVFFWGSLVGLIPLKDPILFGEHQILLTGHFNDSSSKKFYVRAFQWFIISFKTVLSETRVKRFTPWPRANISLNEWFGNIYLTCKMTVFIGLYWVWTIFNLVNKRTIFYKIIFNTFTDYFHNSKSWSNNTKIS